MTEAPATIEAAARAGRATRASKAAALALAALLAGSLAACDSTDDTAAQGSASQSASASPSGDPMAGTTPITKSATRSPSPAPTVTALAHGGPKTSAERAALYHRDAKTIECKPGDKAKALAAVPRLPEQGPLIVVGDDQVVKIPKLRFDAADRSVDVTAGDIGAREMDTVQLCVHVGKGKSVTAWWVPKFVPDKPQGEKEYRVSEDTGGDGWATVSVPAGVGIPNLDADVIPADAQEEMAKVATVATLSVQQPPLIPMDVPVSVHVHVPVGWRE